MEANSSFEHLFQPLDHLAYRRLFGITAPDRYNYDLVSRESWRQYEARFISVYHDNAADHTRTHAPAGGGTVFALSISIQVLNIEAFSEVVAKIMTCTRL